MNEAQVRHDLIDPALRAAGWESLPAKASDKNYRAGEAQARKYAAALGVRYAYATNGSQVFCMDLALGTTSTVELGGFPTLDHALNYYSDIQRLLYAA